MAPMLFFKLLFATSFYIKTTRATSCYYPSGDLSPTDFPCTSSGESVCCGQGFICLSNGLCQNPSLPADSPGIYSRGSCTDKSWKDSSCPNFCVNNNAPFHDLITGGQQVLKCPNSTADNYYCNDAAVADANCTTGENIVKFSGTPTPITAIAFPTETLATTSIPPTATITPTQTPTSSPSPPSYASTHAVQIGASVGASVGFLLLVAIAWFIYYKRKNRMELEEVYKGPLRSSMPASQIGLQSFSGPSTTTAPSTAPKITNGPNWPLGRPSGSSRNGSLGGSLLSEAGARSPRRPSPSPSRPRRPELRESEANFIGDLNATSGGALLDDRSVSSYAPTPETAISQRFPSPRRPSRPDEATFRSERNGSLGSNLLDDIGGTGRERRPSPRRPTRPELRDSETRFISGSLDQEGVSGLMREAEERRGRWI